MGVKHVWSIISPYCERKPLYELQGKKIAIDLSCWICQAQNVTEYHIQPRMYLRNLYFRTCYLLLMDVVPVFVLEGEAPVMKYDTIRARNAVQFKGARPKATTVNKTSEKKDRTRFHHVLKQCSEMLECVGLTCVTGSGEAEATCARLNEEDLVDGCISQDSDCFAYGAKVVYRNFSISQQGAHANAGGAVDVYDIKKPLNSIGFGRNKIIAMAVLCGCDYFEGVSGVGKDSALKFLEKFEDEKVLDRMKSWKSNHSLYEEFERRMNDRRICTSCGHVGNLQNHNKRGCVECKSNKGCDFSRFKNERLAIKNELSIRSKSLADPDFPHDDLIKEYLEVEDNVTELNLKWKRPDMIKFVKFTRKYLDWEEIYAFEKLFPILTRWQLINYSILNDVDADKTIFPDYIKKKRNPKGVPSYEIIWTDRNKFFEKLFPAEQLKEVDVLKLWSTIEPKNLVEKAHPDLVEKFERSKMKPQKAKRKIRAPNDLGEKLTNDLVIEPKPKKITRKSRSKKTKAQTLDVFFKKKVKFCSTPRKANCSLDSFLMNISSLSNNNDQEEDLSLLIQEIMKRNPLDKLTQSFEKQIVESSFFIEDTSFLEKDLFESAFENRLELGSSEKLELGGNVEKSSNFDDSYCGKYVPLLDRLKIKLCHQ